MSIIADLLAKRDLFHFFQPICELPGARPIGYEALIRSHSFTSPEKLFQAVNGRNELYELDTLSVTNAISHYFSTPQHRDSSDSLFVNIFPSTLIDSAFPIFLGKLVRNYEPVARRIVFEINEARSAMEDWNNGLFLQHVSLLRKFGFLIAFDDVGEGATTLKRMVELTPDFVKLDCFFGINLAATKKKQKMIKFLVEYCQDESGLILEGIENGDDLRQAYELGVALGQGYLLSRPGPLPGAKSSELRLNDD